MFLAFSFPKRLIKNLLMFKNVVQFAGMKETL